MNESENRSISGKVVPYRGGWLVSYLDGKKVDQTPAALKGLSPGWHELKLVRKGYKSRVRQVNLRPGQQLSLALGLEKE